MSVRTARAGESFARVLRVAAVVGPPLLLTACWSSGSNPLAGLDEPPPAIAKTSDLDDAALGRIARTAEGSADLIDAASVYRRLAERQPASPEPRIELGRYLLRRGDTEGADAAFREAATLAPNNVEAQLGLAQVMFAQKRSEEAAAAFRAVAERHPGHVRALNGAGAALDGLKRRDEAQAYYRKALAVAPEDPAARNNLGLSLALSGRHDEAIAILRRLAEEPNAAPSHRANLAHVLALKNNPRRAARRPPPRPTVESVRDADGWPAWTPEERRRAAAGAGVVLD